MGELQIDILGTSISLKAKEDARYLKKLLSYYKDVVTQIESATNIKDSLQIAILSGLNLCDELYKEKTKLAKLSIKGKEQTKDTSGNLFSDDLDKAGIVAQEVIEKLDSVL